MAKSKYSSDYTNKLITGAQKLAEMACVNRARQLEVVLSHKFWELPDWKGYFFLQLKQAHTLLEVIPESALFKALQQTEASSLRFGPFIAKAKKISKEESSQAKQVYNKGTKKSTGVFKEKTNIPEDL